MYRFNLKKARDMDVPIFRRPADLRREPTLLDALLQPLVRTVTGTWLRLAHQLEVQGRGHLPTEPPFILVANHTSHLDTAVLTQLMPRHLRHTAFPLAAEDHFFKSTGRAAITTKLVNALPIRRGRAGHQAIELIRRRLIEDRLILILYPEGSRGDGCHLRPFLPGIGLLVASTAIPVVPCKIRGCAQAMPKGCCLPRPGKIAASIGQPMTFINQESSKQSWQSIASQLQTAVSAL